MNIITLPPVIDPHVHFRTPGHTHKEDWISGAKAAFAGGVTTVFDMPNTLPATTTYDRLLEKKALIDAQLNAAKIPLNYRLFFGADKNHFDQLPLLLQHKDQIKNLLAGVKVFMGSSTGDLLMDDDQSLDTLFKICAELDLMVAVHAEHEGMIRERTSKTLACSQIASPDFCVHSEIRSPEVAAKAIAQAIALTRKYGTKLYALHIGSRLEIELLQQAKQEGLPIWIEVAPHYLFLDTSFYPELQGFAKMNPPLRDPHDREFLWEAIEQGWIDTIGSDHAPHPLHDKTLDYCRCPSGVPGVQTTLPLLLTAYHQQKISLENIIALTHTNPKNIFSLETLDPTDYITVDLDLEQTVNKSMLHSKAGWSPYEGMLLKGWPIAIYTKGITYDLSKL
jgi:dihydroorotase